MLQRDGDTRDPLGPAVPTPEPDDVLAAPRGIALEAAGQLRTLSADRPGRSVGDGADDLTDERMCWRGESRIPVRLSMDPARYECGGGSDG